MNAKITILFLVMLLLGVWFLAQRLLNREPGSELVSDPVEVTFPTNQGTSLPPLPTTVLPPVDPGAATEQVTIAGATGATFLVQKFLSDEQQVTLEKQGSIALVDSPYYQIGYSLRDNFFSVLILAEPYEQSRSDAEAFLLGRLGLTRPQLCLLNYSVGIPYWVSEYYTGRELGFASCPGAIPLQSGIQ